MSRQLQMTIIGPQSVVDAVKPQTPQHSTPVCGGPRPLSVFGETDGESIFWQS